MTKYEELQAQHQALLEQRQAGRDIPALVGAVNAYVKRVRDEAEAVPSPRDRDQLRANLRFWATFLYDRTGVYPDTTLRPPLPSVLEAESAAGMAPPPPPTPEVGSTGAMAPAPAPPQGLPIARIAIFGAGAIAVLVIVILGIIFLVRSARNRSTAVYATRTPTQLPGSPVSAAPTELSPFPTETFALYPSSTTPVSESTATPAQASATSTPVMGSTQAAAAEATMTPIAQLPLATATAVPMIPVTGGGGGGGGEFATSYFRPVLLARVSVSPNPLGCQVGEIQVVFDLNPSKSVEQPLKVSEGEFGVDARRVGSGFGVTAPGLRRNRNNFIFPLEEPAGEQTFLVHVEHPLLTADDVIVQMGRDCSKNLVRITYQWEQGASFVSAEPPRNPTLALGWELVNWGPVPQLDPMVPDTSWVAVLNLTTVNPGGRAVFFKYSTYEGFQPLAGNQVLLEGYSSCEPVVMLVGAAFQGQSIAREIRLVSPACVVEVPQPEVSTNLQPIVTLTPTP